MVLTFGSFGSLHKTPYICIQLYNFFQQKGVSLPYFFAMLPDSLRTQLDRLVAEINPEAFIVDTRLKEGKRNVLAVYIDTDEGISLAACAAISRHIGTWLEDKDLFSFSYQLEVSSPGLDMPLKLRRQYLKNIGRVLKVKLHGGRIVKGILLTVAESSITVHAYPEKPKGKKVNKSKKAQPEREEEIAFVDIHETRVVPSF